MFNRSIKATRWLEHYLFTAQSHRDLEQFVLIEGKAKGFSAKLLRRIVTEDPRFELKDGYWAMTDLRVEALEIRARLAQGTWQAARETPSAPVVVEGVDALIDLLAVRRGSQPSA